MDREWLTAKINELAEAREQYLIQSSHRLGQFDGRIAALREVLAALEEGEDETDVRPTDD